MIHNSKLNYAIVKSTSAQAVPENYFGVFNLFETFGRGRLKFIGKNSKYGSGEVELDMDNQLNAGYIFFELEYDDEVGN